MNQLKQFASAFDIQLSAEQLEQFRIYQSFLLEYNAHTNLTRITDPEELVVRHFLDSLTASTVTGDLSQKTLIDVGTGAGFPGVPLKILYPTLRLTLTDRVNKKVQFLEQLCDKLSFKGYRVIHERVENLGMDVKHRQKYDWAVARAVAHLPVLAEYLLPLVKINGKMLAQKGSSAEREIHEAAYALKRLGGGKATFSTVQLPDVEHLHYLITVPKIKRTPSGYPRQAGMPNKNPLLQPEERL